MITKQYDLFLILFFQGLADQPAQSGEHTTTEPTADKINQDTGYVDAVCFQSWDQTS
jgi:hypothetical protein